MPDDGARYGWGEKGFAVGHSVNGVDKVSRLRPLEQASRRAGVQRAEDVIVMFERGEDQDTDVRQSATDVDQIIRRLTVFRSSEEVVVVGDHVVISVDPHNASNTTAVTDPVTRTVIALQRLANTAAG